jgi:hypothetical protein
LASTEKLEKETKELVVDVDDRDPSHPETIERPLAASRVLRARAKSATLREEKGKKEEALTPYTYPTKALSMAS